MRHILSVASAALSKILSGERAPFKPGIDLEKMRGKTGNPLYD